jgi:hypothetical protein
MAGKPLRSQLNQLDISASELREFRRRHDLTPDSEPDTSDDLRDEIEAEVEAATLAAAEAAEAADEEEEDEDEDDGEDRDERDEDDRPRRRRRRRGGRGRRRGGNTVDATFDHGDTDGYGLWLDPAVRDNPVYAENWAGHRAVRVTIEADQITIRRAGGNGNGNGADADAD